MEKRAAREAREYTERYCPTPVMNCTRTDSMTFDSSSLTFVYHCSITDNMDDKELIMRNRQEIHDGLLQNIANNTDITPYKKAGFSFSYIIRSDKKPDDVFLEITIGPDDYTKKDVGEKE